MYKTLLRLLHIIACGLLSASPVYAAFYDESNKLPKVDSITFTPEGVILKTKKDHSTGYKTIPYLDYIVYKPGGSTRQLQPAEADELSHSHPSHTVDTWRSPSRSNFVTTGGMNYQGMPTNCELPRENKLGFRLILDAIPVDLAISSCTYFYEIESSRDYLWIGTYYPGDHGDYGDQGLLVVNRHTGALVKKIDTGNRAIKAVARDPSSNQIWAITHDQITVVESDTMKKQVYQFYHSFNSRTGLPEIRLGLGFHKSSPLAVISGHLPEFSRDAFYRQTRRISSDTAAQLSLYDFYMCCNFRYLDGSLPHQFNVLIPFLKIGAKHNSAVYQGKPGGWRQLACKLDHPEAKTLCETEHWESLTP